jgi:cellulose biosynthesis protein BcsQ
VPSKFNLSTNLGRGLSANLEKMGSKLLPGISQRVVLAEAVEAGMTISEYAPSSQSHEEFKALAKAALKVAG